MTTPAATEQFVTLARRGQEATTTAAQAVTEAFRSYAGAVAPQGTGPVDPQAVATATFDLADRLLRAQRQYVATAISLLSEAGETVTAQASAAGETLKARTEEATTRVVDLAAETTRRATTAARNGVSV
jgi:hypothetical protein